MPVNSSTSQEEWDPRQEEAQPPYSGTLMMEMFPPPAFGFSTFPICHEPVLVELIWALLQTWLTEVLGEAVGVLEGQSWPVFSSSHLRVGFLFPVSLKDESHVSIPLIQTVNKYQNIKNSYNSTIKENLSNLKMGKIFKKWYELGNKHMERCSTSLVIRSCKTKKKKPQWDTLSTSAWMALVKEPDINMCWGYGETGALIHCW